MAAACCEPFQVAAIWVPEAPGGVAWHGFLRRHRPPRCRALHGRPRMLVRRTRRPRSEACDYRARWHWSPARSEEHTSELQSHVNLVCRLLLEKKKKKRKKNNTNKETKNN